jgi:hypothetical protein
VSVNRKRARRRRRRKRRQEKRRAELRYIASVLAFMESEEPGWLVKKKIKESFEAVLAAGAVFTRDVVPDISKAVGKTLRQLAQLVGVPLVTVQQKLDAKTRTLDMTVAFQAPPVERETITIVIDDPMREELRGL